MGMIDLSGVDVMDMLEQQLGMSNVRLTSGGSEANFSCPRPGHAHGDERPSAYMNVETTAYWCFGCHTKGNAISFVADVLAVSKTDAQRWLSDTYGIAFEEPRGGSMVYEIESRFAPIQPKPEKRRPPESFLQMLAVDWWSPSQLAAPQFEYVFGRGFESKTLEHWGAGYDYSYDRITIPVYDLDGVLIGVKGRAWRADHEPKYYVMGDRGEQTSFGFDTYDATEVVYGLHRNPEWPVVVLGEGELNAWAMSQVGVVRPCALGMSYPSKRHTELLARASNEVILFMDPDKAGEGCVWGHKASDGTWLPGAADQLEPYMRVRVVQGHDADPAELLRQGRGSEIIELIESARSTLDLRTAG